MNNSLNIEEQAPSKDQDSMLKEREAKLVRTIEALNALQESREWSTLKTELFDEAFESVEKRIKDEADKAEINTPELYRLQGERKVLRRYVDIPRFTDNCRAELAHIRSQIKPL